MPKMTSSEINALDQAIENIVHDLRYEHRAVEIIRAVNSHAALVEALEACSDALQRATNGDEYGEYETEIAMARTVALLAKGA